MQSIHATAEKSNRVCLRMETQVKPRNWQAESSWQSIPSDVGFLILEKLPEIVERIRFSAVCKRWNNVSREYKQQAKSRCNVLPLFLVPSPNAPAKPEPPRIYALSCYGKHYSTIQIPSLFSERRYYGSSYGWIATQNTDNAIRLINPFGKEVRIIDLPGIRSPHRHSYCTDLCKLVISPDSTPDNYTVLAIYGGMRELATIKSGETSWVYIPRQYNTVPASLFSDIIFYQGDFYAASHYCAIVKIDAQARPPTPQAIIPLNYKTKSHKTYLVESTSSELFLIHRCYTGFGADQEVATIGFNVMKLILDGENGALVEQKEVKNVNGDTFFVGDNASMAIRANACVPNSIYFLDDTYDAGFYKPSGPVDVGFYNIEYGTLKQFYQPNPAHNIGVARPVWIMPHY